MLGSSIALLFKKNLYFLSRFFFQVFRGHVLDAPVEEKWRCYLQAGDLNNLNSLKHVRILALNHKEASFCKY